MSTCGTCQFFLPNGECHRYPPGPQDFLRVSSANWCGEWREASEAEKNGSKRGFVLPRQKGGK